MVIGLISGSGTYEWPELEDEKKINNSNEYGQLELTTGCIRGAKVVHVSRHQPAHKYLSNQVNHRANIAALIEMKVDAILSFTVCGAIDRKLPLGAIVVFDDLYFPSNRLPDGSLCSWHDVPGKAGRGHWIFESPFSRHLRQSIVQAGREVDETVISTGCYGHVDGPRFNTRAEIASLHAAGVAAVSQTAGPEVVLAGEAGVPFALVGFVTDYANGVSKTQDVKDLLALIAKSTAAFASLTSASLPRIEVQALRPAGTFHPFG